MLREGVERRGCGVVRDCATRVIFGEVGVAVKWEGGVGYREWAAHEVGVSRELSEHQRGGLCNGLAQGSKCVGQLVLEAQVRRVFGRCPRVLPVDRFYTSCKLAVRGVSA